MKSANMTSGFKETYLARTRRHRMRVIAILPVEGTPVVGLVAVVEEVVLC